MARKTSCGEFKSESAALMLDQGHTHQETCTAVGVDVSQLQAERAGMTPHKGKALTDAHIEIKKLKKQIKRLEVEKDITSVWLGSCWPYLALVTDLYNRRIVGWGCSQSPDTDLTVAALRIAYESRERSIR